MAEVTKTPSAPTGGVKVQMLVSVGGVQNLTVGQVVILEPTYAEQLVQAKYAKKVK